VTLPLAYTTPFILTFGEATLQRLDGLTLDEVCATAAQTLEVVYDLVRHGKVVLDGKKIFSSRSSIFASRSHL